MSQPRLRALVLAAGRGERLRPLTETLPKPLLPVAGRPLVAWTLERLRRSGIEAVALNLHHRGDAIRAALGESLRGLPLVYSPERELLGTGGALPPLAEFLGAADLVLVVNGDSLCRWPVAELVARHRRDRPAATLLFQRTVDPRDFGGGVALDRSWVTAFRRGDLAWETSPTRRVFAGAALLEPALVGRLPRGPSDIVSALYEPLLAAGEAIAALETARAWHDLGTPARYLAGALDWALSGRPERSARTFAGAAVDPTAHLARVVVEGGATVEAGARVSDALVLPGARVGVAAQVRRSIVGPGAAVAPGERLDGVMRLVAGAAPGDTPLGR